MLWLVYFGNMNVKSTPFSKIGGQTIYRGASRFGCGTGQNKEIVKICR